MKPLFATLAAMSMVASSPAKAASPAPAPSAAVKEVAPQLYAYTTDLLFGEVWKRAELVPRDRSLITLAALVANAQAAQMPSHIRLGLDNGVKPIEITALITHLAFYTGWPNAMSAIGVAKTVFDERGIGPEQLRAAAGERLPLDEASEARRRASVQAAVGEVAPALAGYTNDVLFGDLWRQTDLAPRDRSLVTMAALIARGQSEQLPFHLNRAMDNGLTQVQAAEVITHLAFYAGWPRAMSAVPVAQKVFEARSR